jgi:hypothetical protein
MGNKYAGFRAAGGQVARVLRGVARRIEGPEASSRRVGDNASNPERSLEVASYVDSETRQRDLEELRMGLSGAAVQYLQLAVAPGMTYRFAISGDNSTRVRRFLENLVQSDGWFVEVTESRDGHKLRVAMPMVGDDANWIAAHVRRVRSAHDGLPLAPSGDLVDIEFWRTVPAPRDASNQTPRMLGNRSSDEMLSSVWDEGVTRRQPEKAPAHLFEVLEPIDVVYTWVDSHDRDWSRSKAEALGSLQGSDRHPSSFVESRFESGEDLRYSLRSLSMYADWVNHVYIVTDKQIPDWLDVDSPKITVVDHQDIFSDTSVLPVFNSHAIESQLHHIEGLNEHYLYLNDDVFFGRAVRPDTFFHGNGIAKFFLSKNSVGYGPADSSNLPVDAAARNNRDLLSTLIQRTVTQKFQHTPHPQLRSVMNDLEREVPEVFAKTMASRFRSPEDYSIPSSLFHNYSYSQGKSVPGVVDYAYQDLMTASAANRYRTIAETHRYEVFCLNEVEAEGESRRIARDSMQKFLEAYFPFASEFERKF